MSSTMSTAPSDRPSRRSRAKVRTGCITCKIRHVKCDEGKPTCFRCTNTGRKCDGYAQNHQSNGEQRHLITGIDRVSGPSHDVSIFSAFGDVHYLEFYYRVASRTLSGRSEFWCRTTLQMAHSEPCVRHALIALGCLHKRESASLKDARHGLIDASDHVQHRTLLQHYGKSVNRLVGRISEPSYSPEIGLLSCVLFICIEFLRGDYETAFEHLNGGLRIIAEWKRRQQHPVSSAAHSGLTTSVPQTASQKAMIEEKLIPMFIRMMATALLYGVRVETPFDTRYYPLQIPQKPFKTLIEAQCSLHSLRNSAILFNTAQKPSPTHRITEADLTRQAQILEAYEAWLRALEGLERATELSEEDRIVANSLRVSYHTTHINTSCATSALQTVYNDHLDSFKALLHHAEIILDSINLVENGIPAPSPSTSNPPTTTSSPPASTPTSSKEARKTSPSSIYGSPAPTANFTFEIALIPPLYFTATRCRCPATRRRAVALLARNRRREGLWDSAQHVIVPNRVIEIEESEVDGRGWSVERTRLWGTVINADVEWRGRFRVGMLAGEDFPVGRVGGQRGGGGYGGGSWLGGVVWDGMRKMWDIGLHRIGTGYLSL